MNSITNCIFYKFQVQLWKSNNEEKSYNKRYPSISFSKYNETSPKLVNSEQTSGTVMHAQIQLISMQNAKVLNQERYHIERALGRPNG